MRTVVLTGSAGALGRRVAALLAQSEDPLRVIGIDLADRELPDLPGICQHGVDMLSQDLTPYLDGADCLVHLASAFGSEGAGAGGTDSLLAERVLEAASRCGVGQVVLVSSATVYGAWPDNPVPLTEDVPLRPNPGFAFAQEKVEIEGLAARLGAASPLARIAVLRPTVTLSEDAESWVASALAAAAAVKAGGLDPPVQFLHFDDLASAVVLAVRERLDGTYNVAPDGWISSEGMRALAGVPRIRLPVLAADLLARLGWRAGISRTPPEILPLTMHPWVVANDRLRSAGWVPLHSNEEAYVAATMPGPASTLSPQRRQELALGAAALVLLAAGAAAAALLRRFAATPGRRALPGSGARRRRAGR